MHGFPAALAAATALGPPVVQIRSTPGWWKRYCDASSEGSGMTCSAPGGRPSASPARWRISIARVAQRAARADGRKMIALRVLAATIALNRAVDVGLVIGRR